MHTSDPFSAAAGAYDLYGASTRLERFAALDELLPRLRNDWGPVLDVGAGSGANAECILDRAPTASVFAIEPSAAMRALFLGRIAAHPDWFSRVTVRPEDFFAASLPDQIGGALMLGVIGHFDPGERAAIFAELADRLPVGGVALFDLQMPREPVPVEPFEYTAARVGELTYRLYAEGKPGGGEVMSWHMTYLVLEDERVLTEDVAEFVYRHPSVTTLSVEAEQVGLRMEQLGDSTYWLLVRH